jgi:hypothetical protein
MFSSVFTSAGVLSGEKGVCVTLIGVCVTLIMGSSVFSGSMVCIPFVGVESALFVCSTDGDGSMLFLEPLSDRQPQSTENNRAKIIHRFNNFDLIIPLPPMLQKFLYKNCITLFTPIVYSKFIFSLHVSTVSKKINGLSYAKKQGGSMPPELLLFSNTKSITIKFIN